MRETLSFEVRPDRFSVWRSGVAVVAFAALAAVSAWAWSMASTRDGDGVVSAIGIALVLALATIAAALSLGRVPSGVLACRDGRWTFAADSGPTVAGRLTVALDWGAFFLLRIDGGAGLRLWLPVQRRGLERDWHGLRCALYSPPRVEETSPPLAVAPPE